VLRRDEGDEIAAQVLSQSAAISGRVEKEITVSELLVLVSISSGAV
jgi:hypothetical protein